MSNRPGNHATKKRTPPTPPSASPPHQRRRRPYHEPSEAPSNSPDSPEPAWVPLMRASTLEGLRKAGPFVLHEICNTPDHLTGFIVFPVLTYINTLFNHPSAFTSDEWLSALTSLRGVFCRGLEAIDDIVQLANPSTTSPDLPLPTLEVSNTPVEAPTATPDPKTIQEPHPPSLEATSPTTPTTSPLDPGTYPQSYARAASPTNPSSRELPSNPKPARTRAIAPTQARQQSRDPVRYVVDYAGTPPPAELRLPPQEVLSRISTLISGSPGRPQVTFCGSRWNKSGNLVLSFSPESPPLQVKQLVPGIRTALGLHHDIPLTQVVPWSRLVVSSVPARPSLTTPVYSSDSLLEALVQSNPLLKNIALTRKPQWVREPSLIRQASSFAFSFQDPDGSVAQQVLKSHIYIFGAPVSVRRWKNKPRPVKAAGIRGPT